MNYESVRQQVVNKACRFTMSSPTTLTYSRCLMLTGPVMKCQQTSAVNRLLIIDTHLHTTTICRLEVSGGDSSVEMK